MAHFNNKFNSKHEFMKEKAIAIVFIIFLFSCTSSNEDKNTRDEQEESTVKILSSEGRKPHSVYITKNYNQQPVICWTEEDTLSKIKYVYYSVSSDNGNSFSEKNEIPVEQTIQLHAEGMPKIAFRKNGDVYAFYEVTSNSEVNHFAGEIHYKLSTDNGKNWSTPNRVHQDSTKHKGWSFFDVAMLSNGEIGACWLDTSNPDGGRPVKFAKTNATGKFSDEVMVDDLACECCRTGIYCDESGIINIVYRDIIQDSIRDISVATSSDGGKIFSKPICFSGDNWNIQGCPHNGPDVVSDSNGIYAVWFTGTSQQGLYYAELNSSGSISKKEQINSEGRNIQIALLPDGNKIMVYNESYKIENTFYSTIKFKKGNQEPVILTDEKVSASLPVILALNNSQCIVTWLEENNGQEQVVYKLAAMQ